MGKESSTLTIQLTNSQLIDIKVIAVVTDVSVGRVIHDALAHYIRRTKSDPGWAEEVAEKVKEAREQYEAYEALLNRLANP